ncbi:hypothetical protein KM043_009172 [Ampulex compressa]|nr:hypothetical protein KM043_009172 [Ampulex compressa]
MNLNQYFPDTLYSHPIHNREAWFESRFPRSVVGTPEGGRQEGTAVGRRRAHIGVDPAALAPIDTRAAHVPRERRDAGVAVAGGGLPLVAVASRDHATTLTHVRAVSTVRVTTQRNLCRR